MKMVKTEVLYLGKPPLIGYRTQKWKTYRWWKPTHWFKTKRYQLLFDNGPTVTNTVTVGGHLPDGYEVVLKKVAHDTWEVQP